MRVRSFALTEIRWLTYRPVAAPVRYFGLGLSEVPAAAGTHPGPRVVPDQSLGESEPLRFDPSMRPSGNSFCGDCFGILLEAWIIPTSRPPGVLVAHCVAGPRCSGFPAGSVGAIMGHAQAPPENHLRRDGRCARGAPRSRARVQFRPQRRALGKAKAKKGP